MLFVCLGGQWKRTWCTLTGYTIWSTPFLLHLTQTIKKDIWLSYYWSNLHLASCRKALHIFCLTGIFTLPFFTTITSNWEANQFHFLSGAVKGCTLSKHFNLPGTSFFFYLQLCTAMHTYGTYLSPQVHFIQLWPAPVNWSQQYIPFYIIPIQWQTVEGGPLLK